MMDVKTARNMYSADNKDELHLVGYINTHLAMHGSTNVKSSFSLDAVPSDCQLFGFLKKPLASNRSAADADVKQAVTRLQTLDTDFLYFDYKPWCHDNKNA
jgi:hypothetical protein